MYGIKGKGAEFDCSGSLLMVWLKYEALSTFPLHQRSLKPLALKWAPLRLSDNALQQVFHNQNESWYFWKGPESCQHICLGWMTDSFGQVLLPLFPFPNKIRIKIKPSVDWSSHPSSKYFFLHFFLMAFKKGECLGFFSLLSFSSVVHHKTDWGTLLILIYVWTLHVKNQGGKAFWNVKNTGNIRREWNRKEKVLCETQFIKKNAEKTHPKFEKTICIK